MKKVVAINASPRKGWNTDMLIREAARGAESAGAQAEYISLFDLDRYTGCVSCFACKTAASYGKCACKDGLAPVLEKIRNADALIIGSPVYLSNLSASFRALFERLVFQYLTYNAERPNCNERLIPVLLAVTSNCAEEQYDAMGYTALLDSYKSMLGNYVGPTQLLVCGDTLQVDDYSRFDWRFDAQAKKARREQSFGAYLRKAFEMGRELV